MQRHTLDAPTPNLNDLGKGVPFFSVPGSWPLYIVEFKAGHTALFYLTDVTLDIRVGDLVIGRRIKGPGYGRECQYHPERDGSF
ncbi:hypothetical protein SCLCIDRAFT_129253 [Scleroderma citrinum Foug A]|uniref:Uncharacterized protein n=1 Tax=Scleroderma citrinum Foug A TaxID=1036808 RepID=A0A0C3DBG2_9AGAM|nr:hypothetical protein SCLCIDRAFT_129253 [Scleroderma citrinum Foug A]